MTKSKSTEPRFNKSLGQYFLRDKDVARRIADSIGETDSVVEIGPGDGFLTNELLSAGYRVIAVELDRRWVSKLKSRLRHYTDFRLITGNILNFDWSDIDHEPGRKTIAGNLPYHLTGPITFAVFDHVRATPDSGISQMVIMVQREVGERITALPNSRSYGGLTLLVGYHADTEYLLTVPAAAFMPRPKVDGAVVRIRFKDRSAMPNVDYARFRRVVRACFAQRRKMMRNSLTVLNDLPDGWRDLDYDFTLRPENFDLDRYVSLTKDILRLQRAITIDR